MTAITCAGLLAALKAAAAGAVLALPPGTCVLTDTVNGVNPSGVVTVTAQDPAHPPVLVALKIADSSNLRFSHIEMTTVGNPDTLYGFRMYTDTNISFDHDDIHGDPGKAPGAQSGGFYIKPGTNISITNSRLHDMDAAISAGPIEGLTVTGNQFYRLSKGGLHFAAAGNMTFSNNTCTDFHITVLVHSDCLQGFTAGTTTASHDITITNNTLSRGGGDAFQGLFLGDEVGTLPFKNVTVTGNVVWGGLWDSIYLDGMTGNLTVTGNSVGSWYGYTPEGGEKSYTDLRGWISIKRATTAHVVETGNIAQSFPGDSNSQGAPAGNTLIGAVGPGSQPPIRK